MSDVRVVVTLPATGDAAMVEAQRAFHLHAGADAIVDPGEVATSGADWILPVSAEEFWWPRGARYAEILSRIPADYDVVQALVRPFLRVEGGPERPFEPSVHRLSAEAYAGEPGGRLRPQRRLAHRAGVDVSRYAGEIVKSSLRPLRGWYPIEVLWFPQNEAPQPADEVERGVERGTVHVDTRLRDMLRALQAGGQPGFPRPSVVDNAWYAADAAVLGEADAFRIRGEMDELEQRLAELEESLLVRVDRKLRSVLRRGRANP